MIWRRCVVYSLGSVLGLLLYLASRVVRGGATSSLLYGAHVASRLGCTEITALGDRDTLRRPPATASIRSDGPLI
jgi:hypothetical protein